MIRALQTPRPLRSYLIGWLGGLLLLVGGLSYALQRYGVSQVETMAEAQVRALSRTRAEQGLLQSLLEEEAALRGMVALGERRDVERYRRGQQEGVEALRDLDANIGEEDRSLAQPLVDRLEAELEAWHALVAERLLEADAWRDVQSQRRAFQEIQGRLEGIRLLAGRLGGELDGRDNARLAKLERQLRVARSLSALLFLGLAAVAILGGRRILHLMADPLVELSEYARGGLGFPQPDEGQAIREVDILHRALWELDTAAREREEGLRQRGEEAQAVRAFTELVQQVRSEAELCGTLERTLVRLLGAERCRVLIKPTVGDGLAEEGEAPAFQEALNCRAFRAAGPVQLGVEAPTACDCALGVPDQGAYLCLPLVAAGQILGVVNLQARRANHWDEHRRRLAESCASVAAASLQVLRALALARDRALRDDLTGVLNRRFLGEVLPKFVGQALRAEQPLSVVMADVDHFKRVNDQLGHAAGDRVLRTVAQALRARLREGDLVLRYGGEEFVLLLPQTPLDQAMHLAERLRHGLEHLDWEEAGLPQGMRITSSFGVATLPQHTREGERLLAVADQALYAAKEQGRNRVVAAG